MNLNNFLGTPNGSRKTLAHIHKTIKGIIKLHSTPDLKLQVISPRLGKISG